MRFRVTTLSRRWVAGPGSIQVSNQFSIINTAKKFTWELYSWFSWDVWKTWNPCLSKTSLVPDDPMVVKVLLGSIF